MSFIADLTSPTIEWVARQIIWRSPFLYRLKNKYVKKKKNMAPLKSLSAEELEDALTSIGVGSKSSVTLVHSSVTSWRLKDGNHHLMDEFETARETLRVLLKINDGKTLVMPTHPFYRETVKNPFFSTKSLKLKYDPRRTPCETGLINEMFRTMPGVERSLYPLNNISCFGPKTKEILKGNLETPSGTPHGEGSGYYNIFKNNALVVSIGVPLPKHLTIAHVAEDVRYEFWPKWFYRNRHFDVVTPEGVQSIVIRERHPDTRRCICEKAIERDLCKNGIIHKESFNGILFHWAMAQDVVHYILKRNGKNGNYPFYLLNLAGPISQ